MKSDPNEQPMNGEGDTASVLPPSLPDRSEDEEEKVEIEEEEAPSFLGEEEEEEEKAMDGKPPATLQHEGEEDSKPAALARPGVVSVAAGQANEDRYAQKIQASHASRRAARSRRISRGSSIAAASTSGGDDASVMSEASTVASAGSGGAAAAAARPGVVHMTTDPNARYSRKMQQASVASIARPGRGVDNSGRPGGPYPSSMTHSRRIGAIAETGVGATTATSSSNDRYNEKMKSFSDSSSAGPATIRLARGTSTGSRGSGGADDTASLVGAASVVPSVTSSPSDTRFEEKMRQDAEAHRAASQKKKDETSQTKFPARSTMEKSKAATTSSSELLRMDGSSRVLRTSSSNESVEQGQQFPGASAVGSRRENTEKEKESLALAPGVGATAVSAADMDQILYIGDDFEDEMLKTKSGEKLGIVHENEKSLEKLEMAPGFSDPFPVDSTIDPEQTIADEDGAMLLTATLVEEVDEAVAQEEREQIFREAQQQAEEEMRQRMMETVVHAEAAEAIDDEMKPRSYKDVFILLCCLLVVIGAVLGGVLGTQLNKDSDGNNNEKTLPEENSLVSTNDICTEAEFFDLSSGFSSAGTTYTTKGAIQDEFPSCGTGEMTSAVGVWFEILATGLPIRATVRSSGGAVPLVSVFEGGCAALMCIASSSGTSCGVECPVTFPTLAERPYSILVASSGEGSEGFDFFLDIEETIPNDLCATAQELFPSPTMRTVSGSFEGASTNLPFGCPNGVDKKGPSSWYLVRGEALPVYLSTCGSTNATARITVLQGGCDSLSCAIPANYIPCGPAGKLNSITFLAESGTDYYVEVSGEPDTQVQSYEVAFRQTVANDICELSALFSDTNFSVNGNTNNEITESHVNVTIDAASTCESGAAATGRGSWYEVNVTSRSLLRASTCGSPQNSTARVTALVGNCGALRCPEGSLYRDCNKRNGEVAIATNEGDVVRFLVTTVETDTYDFSLRITENEINDLCEAAIELPNQFAGLFRINGSTFRATVPDEFLGRCGGATDVETPGVWYKIKGDGKILRASTCTEGETFDTQITVVSGDCGELHCITGNDQFCGDQSQVRWYAASGIDYFVIVHGYFDGQVASIGDFELSLSEETVDFYDICEEAVVPLGFGQTDLSATSPATPDAIESCGGLSTSGPGVWYSVIGTGEVAVASTCGASDFETRLAVFAGTDCDSLVCFANVEYGGCDARWQTVPGQTYYILVHGANGSSGFFTIRVDTAVTNDNCNSAFALRPGEVQIGTTQVATPSEDALFADFCDVDNAPGVWFSVEGTGRVMVASLCGEFTNYDTKLHVFEGSSCSALMCVAFNDDACRLQSAVTWQSTPGVPYYVYVSGFDDSRGEFEIILTEVDAAPNDECENSVTIGVNETLAGSTLNGTLDAGLGGCGSASAPESSGVWYSFTVDTETFMNVTTCGTFGYDTQLSVFSSINESCHELSCVAGNDDYCDLQSAVIFAAQPGLVYKILVHGFAGAFGDFFLSVFDVGNLLSNDQCEAAEMISINSVVAGSTEFASVDAIYPFCGSASSPTSPGVWYSFLVDTATMLNASLCTYATFDTQLSVFSTPTGTENCALLECVDGNDDACGLQSEVIFFAQPGLGYKILVHGFDASEFGDFELSVSEAERPQIADTCAESGTLVVDEWVQTATYFATPDVSSVECISEIYPNSIWFSVVGTGLLMSFSTCDFSNVNKTATVYAAGSGCDALECLADVTYYSCQHVDDNLNPIVQDRLVWFSEEGQVYQVMVTTNGPDAAWVRASTLPPANICENSIAVSLGGTGGIVSGFIDATSSMVPSVPFGACGDETLGLALAYSFVATNFFVTTSLCVGGVSSFPGWLNLYEDRLGLGCSTVQCAIWDDFWECDDGLTYGLRWFTVPGETYYVTVQGLDEDTVGSFELVISESSS